MLAGWMDVGGPNKEFGVVDFADEPALKILKFHDNGNPPSLSGNGRTSQPPCATIASASVWR
jgi:hypothetical protein